MITNIKALFCACGAIRRGSACAYCHSRDAVSPEQLAHERAEAIITSFRGAPTTFTCDTCEIAAECALAFDAYNTNGDCLAEK